jgi:hypothetical protein
MLDSDSWTESSMVRLDVWLKLADVVDVVILV